MKQDEAVEKIMKAADHYASCKQDISNAHDRGTDDDYEEAERMTKESRQELEQRIRDIVEIKGVVGTSDVVQT